MPRLALPSVLLAVSMAACTRPPKLPPGWTVDEARAFQDEHARSIGAPDGPLSVIDSYYVEQGHSLVLGAVGGRFVPKPADDLATDAKVTLELDGDGARCRLGCAPDPTTPVSLDEPRDLPLGRFTLRTSLQSGMLRVLVIDPQSPARTAFDGLRWFPVDPQAIVPARWDPDPDRPQVELSTSRGLTKAFARAGTLRAELGGAPIELHAYQMGGADSPLLVPLTDETTGGATYPVGRYLEVEVPAEGPAVLDLNRLTNPWCAYSEHFNCPVPPADNRLTVAVEAGEQVYEEH